MTIRALSRLGTGLVFVTVCAGLWACNAVREDEPRPEAPKARAQGSQVAPAASSLTQRLPSREVPTPLTRLTAASLSIRLRVLPQEPDRADEWSVEAKLTNSGASTLGDVALDVLRVTGLGALRLIEESATAERTLAPGESQIVRLTYGRTRLGKVMLEARAAGRDVTGARVYSAAARTQPERRRPQQELYVEAQTTVKEESGEPERERSSEMPTIVPALGIAGLEAPSVPFGSSRFEPRAVPWF